MTDGKESVIGTEEILPEVTEAAADAAAGVQEAAAGAAADVQEAAVDAFNKFSE